ncbi:sensor histidine kinase [Falsibacillus albus]|uniref:histidine kinase n=1 Tax=Falsibacillus albus TaxID=2478915 RepID=A0A3L7K404_9BACI|nr:sensor histidine kinase [Falsibacillus albus]RLQ96741.1 sensor histidine kinase [Falsibacillus albus]
MDKWLIIHKIIIIAFIILNIVRSKTGNVGWIVFYLLLYLSLNLVMYIVRHKQVERIANAAALITVIYAASCFQSMLILLFPMNIFELLSSYRLNKLLMLTASALPFIFLEQDIMGEYGLITALSFIFFFGIQAYFDMVERYESRMDMMRVNLQKLSRNLNENNEFIRQSEYTFKLEERNRLSQEIHDNIGHVMTGALIQMEASKHLMDKDKNKAVELLQNAINLSKDGIEKIRLTLKNMKPPVEQMGVHRIKLVIDEFMTKHDIQVTFVHKGNLDKISPLQWKIIHENLLESLTNVMKYANATTISLELNVLNKFIRFEVKDNGVGTMKVKKGLGIVGMEERTASVKGTIIVDGTNGFSVTTLLPLT